MPKYDTGRNDGEAQSERIAGEWTERPFTAHDRRRNEVEHRVVVEAHEGVGVDVRHEIRSTDADHLPSVWTPAKVFEARDHGVTEIETGTEGWFPDA